MRARSVLLLSLLTLSCGDSSPVAPSDDMRVSGVWMGHATLMAATGGSCVGSALQGAIGSRDIFAALVQQSGSSLTATIGSQGNQTICAYTGTTRDRSVNLTLSSCQASRVTGVQCADGSRYDVQLVSERISAEARSAGPGTSTSTWQVFTTGSNEPVGMLNLSVQFLWNELGIPHSDFHVFDGSVRPGYVDGVVVIPEEVNPFCDKCGWF